jgi:hypothetical protein
VPGSFQAHAERLGGAGRVVAEVRQRLPLHRLRPLVEPRAHGKRRGVIVVAQQSCARFGKTLPAGRPARRLPEVAAVVRQRFAARTLGDALHQAPQFPQGIEGGRVVMATPGP